MNLLIAVGLSDYKLNTTIEPLSSIDDVNTIYMVRKTPFSHNKVICYSPPKFMRSATVFYELYRIYAIFYLCIFKKIDYIIGVHIYLHSVYAAIAGMIFRKPYVISIIEDPKLYKKNKLFHFISKKAMSIGVRGSNSKEFLEEKLGINPDNVFILPDFYEFSNIEKKENKNKKYDFLFLGEFVKEKRIDILIDVFSKLKEKEVDFKAAIAGDGILKRRMDEYFNIKGLETNVDMLGYVDNIYEVIKQSKVLIMTSETEGMPTVLIEAMSWGIPCIVPDVGDITDFAKDGYNALVYELLNVDACANACIHMLSDEKLYNNLCDNTKVIWEEKRPLLRLNNVSSVWRCMFHI